MNMRERAMQRGRSIQPSSHKSASGFTVIELLVVLTVSGVLLAIAAPSFGSFITSTRLTAQANDLVADVRLARSEAASRGVRVVICPSSDSGATCSASAADWNKSRIIFLDRNSNGDVDSGETLLKQRTESLGGDTTVASSGFSEANLTFSPYGGLWQGGGLGAGAFKLCTASSSTGRSVQIDSAGRPQAKKVACP